MQRRVLVFSACLVLAAASPSSMHGEDGLVDHLIHAFMPAHRKSSAKASASHAGEIVWSGLVMAENTENPEPAPAELIEIEPTLKGLFGYNQFVVIGQSRKTLRTGQEDWLASSKHFALHVDAQGPSEGGYIVNLKLVQRDNTEPPAEQLILETATKLSKRSPLVIKGPQIGGGQLLLVLVVQ
ncbi:MAG TPA: hypothetical protein VGG94_08085 [Chthoniobacterales bacterium]